MRQNTAAIHSPTHLAVLGIESNQTGIENSYNYHTSHLTDASIHDSMQLMVVWETISGILRGSEALLKGTTTAMTDDARDHPFVTSISKTHSLTIYCVLL